MSAPERPVEFEITVPDELEGGVYANVLNVWHTPYEFTLDFGVLGPAREPPDEDEPIKVPVRVTSRVRVPPTILFDILRALNQNMTTYEMTFGTIQRMEGPDRAQESEGEEGSE
jgi:hypothetical protein